MSGHTWGVIIFFLIGAGLWYLADREEGGAVSLVLGSLWSGVMFAAVALLFGPRG